jgi:hypothetical protein
MASTTKQAWKCATSSVDDGAMQVKKKKPDAKSEQVPRKGNKEPARKKKQR